MIQPTHLKKKIIEVDYNDTKLIFKSDFDSGNLWKAELNKQTNEIILQSGRDRQNNPSTKNWFYFSIEGNSEDLYLNLVLEKCNILQPVSKVQDVYRPVIRYPGQPWRRLPTMVEFESIESMLRMKFSVKIQKSKKLEISLIYPWSVQQNQIFLQKLVSQTKLKNSIYINKETIVYSYEKRPIHLISISSSQAAENKTETYIEGLFPQKQTETHYKYSDKPIILIISRVHPGEVGSSHSCNGMLKYLVSDDPTANKLRKQFFFWIIPILNPDGVYNGNNRMDALGQNLNRFYHLPDRQKQSSCFAVKSLVESCRKQLYAFFDLHGHANRKSCFLYGNSIPLARLQAQSLLFAKILSLKCQQIDFNSCNFSKRQMSTKDKSDQLTKQGCARVVIHRWSGSPYCYTLQTGLHKNVKVDDKGIQRFSQQFYTIQTYENLGKQMLISLYEVLSKSKKTEQLRKQMIVLTAKLQKQNAKPTKPRKSSSNVPKLKELKQSNTLIPSTQQIISSHSLQKELDSKQRIGLQCDNDENNKIQQLLGKNKHQLLALDEDDQTYD